MKKRIIVTMLTLLLLVAFTSCGGTKGESFSAISGANWEMDVEETFNEPETGEPEKDAQPETNGLEGDAQTGGNTPEGDSQSVNTGENGESYLPEDFLNLSEDEEGSVFAPGLANACLYSLYDSPEAVDLYELFYGEGLLELTEEDRKFLEEQGAIVDLDIMKFTVEEMNRVLQEYFGLTLAETEGAGLEKFYHNEETDTYYLMHSDSNDKYINILEEKKNPDGTVELLYTLRELPEGEDVSGERTAVLKEVDGRYIFCSNREAE